MGISYFESAGITTVPSFLTARTPNGLRRAMLRNNTKHKGFVKYQDIQWIESEKAWYVWFYVDITKQVDEQQSLIDMGDS